MSDDLTAARDVIVDARRHNNRAAGSRGVDVLLADALEHLDAALLVRRENWERITELEDWVRDAGHHPGCSGGYEGHRCRCGRDDLLGTRSDEVTDGDGSDQ